MNFYKVNKVLEWIESTKDWNVPIAKIVEYSGISEFHLQRSFTRIVGLSLRKYIRCRQLSEGARLLLKSNKTIEWVSAETKWNSIQSFSRAFQNRFGISPSEYRQKNVWFSIMEPFQVTGDAKKGLNNDFELIVVDELILCGSVFKGKERNRVQLIKAIQLVVGSVLSSMNRIIRNDYIIEYFDEDFDSSELCVREIKIPVNML